MLSFSNFFANIAFALGLYIIHNVDTVEVFGCRIHNEVQNLLGFYDVDSREND